MIASIQPVVISASGSTSYSAYRQPINSLPHSAPYLETDKLRALAVYAETGNQSAVERETGVPQETVRNWVNDEANGSLIGELRSTIRYNEGWRLAKLVSRGLDEVEKSFDQGDAVVLKDGRIVYRRASLRDNVIAMSILMDKWMMISGAISNETMLLGKMGELAKQLDGLGASLSPAPEPPREGPAIQDPPGEKLMW